MANFKVIEFCAHCGNETPQQIIDVRSSSQTARVLTEVDWGEEIHEHVTYLTAVCGTCNSILVYCSGIEYLGDTELIDLEEAIRVYPTVRRLHRSVPEEISRLYWNAFRIKKTAPDAFVMQIRRALEAVCNDRGAQGKSLHNKLADLFSKGELPQIMFEVANETKDFGNIAVHEADEKIRMWQANTIDDYFRAIIEYIYVLPNKLGQFRDSLDRLRARRVQQESEAIH
jgi:hypothetical protein